MRGQYLPEKRGLFGRNIHVAYLSLLMLYNMHDDPANRLVWRPPDAQRCTRIVFGCFSITIYGLAAKVATNAQKKRFRSALDTSLCMGKRLCFKNYIELATPQFGFKNGRNACQLFQSSTQELL